jgi:hypothetical protein
LNWDIVGAMLTVKELMLTAGTVAEAAADEAGAEDAGAEELDELEDEQPAAVRARAAATATQVSRGKRRNLPPPCERESQPPSLLLLTRIPHTLSYEDTRISRPGHRCSRGVPAEEASSFDIRHPGPKVLLVRLQP